MSIGCCAKRLLDYGFRNALPRHILATAFPTVLAVAAVAVPEGILIRGRNMLPLLRGESVPWDSDIYAEYSTHHQSRTYMRMIRTPEWKLVRDFLNSERDELYHLSTDPAETHNLIGSESIQAQEVVSKLHRKIIQKMAQIHDPVLELAPRRN